MRRRWRRRLLGIGLRLVAGIVLLSVLAVLPWRWLAPPTSAFMLQDRFGRGTSVRQEWVPLERISRELALCVIAAEDQKFPTHHGFDLQSLWSALQEDRRRPRGASTLTQQVAKNLYLWPGRSLLRKGLEAWLTLWIELLWPKQRILEVYLNIAELGPGAYGAEVGSRRAFGKSAARLGRQEAALLAAVLPSPRRMSAGRPSEYVRGRAREIEAAAGSLGPGALDGIWAPARRAQ